MVRRAELAGTNASPGLVPWFCALAPDAVPDYAYLLESAARPVAIEPVTGQGIIRLTQLGALLYRTQHYPEAIQQLTEAHTAWENATPKPNGWSPAYATLFLAMAHQQMGHPDEATRWVQRGLDLEAAESRSPHTGMPLPWHRRLSVAWLYREAQALLGAAQTADHPAVDQSAPTTP